MVAWSLIRVVFDQGFRCLITGTVFRQRVPQWATADSDIKVKPHMVEQYFYHPLKSKLGERGGGERQTQRQRQADRQTDRQTMKIEFIASG